MVQPFKADKLHLQVQEHLRGLIGSGAYLPGDQLPSEVELAAQLGVSRPTLREALLHLEQDGAIVRKHGVGTFVSKRTPLFDSGLEVLESLERQARRMGLNTQVVHLEVEEREPTHDETEALSLSGDGSASVLSVDRVIAVEGRRVAHLRDVVPQTRLCKEDLGAAFSGSVLDILLQQGAPPPVTSRTEILAEGADSQTAALLGIPAGTSLLRLVGQLFGNGEQVLDYSVSSFVPGYFRFHVMRRVGAG
jgi:GntR family transcriptional regulator